tara:strand:+ start:969 stop:2513 length:1545 start_codon:yes stop_codon:yes gene_type:complete
MDFASGLMSFTTGAVKGGIKLQKQREEREDALILGAEQDAATEVETMINDARAELRASQNLFNTTTNNQIKNWESIASEYGPEYQDDLSILAVSRPDLFQGEDMDKIRANVSNFMSVGPLGGDITPESAVTKQFYADYGEGATGASVFRARQDAYNTKVRNNMSQLVGSNSTKLLLDDYLPKGAVKGDETFIRPKKLERVQEGRVSREAFLGNINDLVNNQLTTNPDNISQGAYMQTVNWIPTLSVNDMRANLIANGVTDITEQNASIMVAMGNTRKALEMQGFKGDALRTMVDKGVITEDNIAVMQDSIQGLVLDHWNNALIDIARTSDVSTNGQLVKDYLNDPNMAEINPDGYKAALSIVKQQMIDSQKAITSMGYTNMVGEFIKTVDPKMMSVLDPELAIGVKGDDDKIIPGVINPRIVDGTLKITDYNGNELGTKTLEFFFLPITTTKEISKDGPRGIGDSDITTIVEEEEVIGYDAIYGKAAGDKIRQLIFNNNGGQAAVIAMLPKIEN